MTGVGHVAALVIGELVGIRDVLRVVRNLVVILVGLSSHVVHILASA
jgi:hypothetical protein